MEAHQQSDTSCPLTDEPPQASEADAEVDQRDQPPAALEDDPKAQADLLTRGMGATFLNASMSKFLGGRVGSDAHYAYLDRICRETEVENPIEQMILEQVTWAHHSMGRLHVESAHSSSIEAVSVYLSAITRLMAECRRSMLALKELQKSRRETAKPVATNTSEPQTATSHAEVNGKSVPAKDSIENGVVSIDCTTNGNGHVNRIKPFVEKSSAGRGRKKKPTKTRSAVNGRS